MKRIAYLITVAAAWQLFAAAGFAGTTVINSSSATPTTISFAANDPDTPSVPGGFVATITFNASGGASNKTWSVQVQATTANFGSCPSTIPASAVKVTCASVATSGNGNGAGSCAAASNLFTSFITVASGTEDSGNNSTYTATVNFTFTDSWSYIATNSACTLGLSYLITAN